MPCMPSLARVMPVISLFIALFPYPKRLDHDPIRLNRIMISSLCLSMISGQTLRVCPDGKPASTFPDHARALPPSYTPSTKPCRQTRHLGARTMIAPDAFDVRDRFNCREDHLPFNDRQDER